MREQIYRKLSELGFPNGGDGTTEELLNLWQSWYEGNVRHFHGGACHFDSPKIHGISLFLIRVPHSAAFHKYDYTLCAGNLKEKAESPADCGDSCYETRSAI